LIEREALNTPVEALGYSVLIYESFNRPTLYQFVESYLLFPLKLAHSFGPMQVRADRRLSAADSVVQGIRKLERDFQVSLAEIIEERRESLEVRRRRDPVEGIELPAASPEAEAIPIEELLSLWDRQSVLHSTLRKYNVRSDYASEVEAIFSTIFEKHYPDLIEKWVGLG